LLFRKPDLLRFAQKAPRSPLAGTKLDDVEFADGWIRRKDGTAEVSLADAMRAGKRVRDLPITIDKLLGK
jgi:hypothetical protein